MDDSNLSFIWKKSEQDRHLEKYKKEYIGKLFDEVKNNGYLFYVEFDDKKNNFKNIIKYHINGEKINLEDYYSPKKLNSDLVKGYHENRFDDHDYENIAFSIKKFDFWDDGGCGRCGMNYASGGEFYGLAYNTKYNGDKPVKYKGYIKQYYILCNCYKPEETEYKYEEEYTSLPFVEIDISPDDNSGMCFLKLCINFDLKYMKFSDSGLEGDVKENC